MIYKAKPQSFFLKFLLVLGGVRVTNTKELTVMNVLIIIAIVVALCIHYQFQIEHKRLTYQIFLLTIHIYKRNRSRTNTRDQIYTG